MKKVVSIILCAVILLSSVVIPAFAEEMQMSPRANNVAVTESSFEIIDGNAVMCAMYRGYEGVTTGAHITIKLEKRSLLVFWNDITEFEINHTGVNGAFERIYYSLEDGTYRATITYEISGSGGAADVIEDVIKKSL